MFHELYVRRWGAGPPVMYVHGLGASSRYWSVLADRAPTHAGVAPDLLGFGRSPRPPDSMYDVEAHLACLLPLLPTDAVVVGHSTGAILAAALACAAVHRVRALLLLGLPAFPDEAAAGREVSQLGTMARLTASESWVASAICMAMCELRPLLIPLAPVLVRDVPAEVASDFVRHTWPSYSRTLRNVVLGHPAVPDLAQLQLPVVLVHGAADRDARVGLVEEAVQTLRTAGRDVTLHVVDGDHHLALRRPDVVGGHLADLLS
jgi:pimeloyl-ACP methyl ester carboxylesterase